MTLQRHDIKSTLVAVKGAEGAIKANRPHCREPGCSGIFNDTSAFGCCGSDKNADIGDIVTPLGAAANAKASVVTIADMNSLQVEVDVSESTSRM